MKLFDRFKKKNSNTRVGPLLHILYESIDKDNRPAFKKHISKAPSGSEIIATFESAPVEMAQAILAALQRIPMNAVCGAELLGSNNFIVYVKGDIPEKQLQELAVKIRLFPQVFMAQYKGPQRRIGEVDVQFGRLNPRKLKELP